MRREKACKDTTNISHTQAYTQKKDIFLPFACVYEKKAVLLCAKYNLIMRYFTKILLMSTLALMAAGCQPKQDADKAPITKPEITIPGGRLTPEALWAMGRIGSVQVDVETGWIAYTVSYYSVAENRSTTWIRVADPTQHADNGEGMRTIAEFVGSEPAWFGGAKLAFLRGGKLYIKDFAAKKSPEIAVAGCDRDIEGFLFSPWRNKVVLISAVKTVESTVDRYPDLDKATGHVHDDLMYKHWDEWVTEAPQPFVYEVQTTYKGAAEMELSHMTLTGEKNILEGTAFESPMRPFGGVEQLAWSQDGKTLAYTCRKKIGIDYAVSTNSDIYLYNLETGEEQNITEGNGGYDTNPAFSPDGSKIAWLSMERDGYESDENRLMVMDLATAEKTFVSKNLDTNVDEYYWEDSEHIVFSACWHALVQLYRVNVNDNVNDNRFEQLTEGQYDHVPVATVDGQLYYLRHSMREANELYCDGVNLTHENDNIYSQIEMGEVIPRWQKTTDGKQMLTWIILPPHFDPAKKYPTLLYCEGGPQSPVSQFWSFRWNFMMMSANDYVIVAPNRRGLPGFGKDWNEEISGDYGGQCMRDYFTAIDEACANLPYVDKDRLGAVGASFGGYSVYWIAGHHDHRFKAFIAHDGIFNMEMQYLETEEKWFANWDMGGAYWDRDNAVAQRTFANSPHRFVDKWDTPILCIHGEKDYRILANQAMAAFDAAKMRGVEAQLLIFPDENHWVLQPQNGILWQRTFYSWLDRYLK